MNYHLLAAIRVAEQFPDNVFRTLMKTGEDQTFRLSAMKRRLVVIVTSLLQELQELRGSATCQAYPGLHRAGNRCFCSRLRCRWGDEAMGERYSNLNPPRLQKVSKTILEANHTACKAEDVSWDSLTIVDRNFALQLKW